MNRVAVAQELVAIAKLISGEREITAAEMRKICPACADKMNRLGIAAVRESEIASALKEASQKQADRWYDLPKGWDTKSRKEFWESLTGDKQHKITECMEKIKGHVSDPGKFCGALASRVSYR